MKSSKALKEIHEIMEKIHDEEKNLNAEQRIAKIREESDGFLKERKISLKRVKPRSVKHSAA